MPNMDGFALSKAIRSEEAPSFRIPIIAITANAMQGEDQRCIQAGMDDYLSKPLRLHELSPMLEKWLPLQNRLGESLNVSEVLPESVADRLATNRTKDTIEIWNSGSLRQLVGDNRDMHRRLLEKFLTNTKKQVPAISEADAVSEISKVVALSHTLKSAARSVGAMALGELCHQIETVGQAGDASACSELVEELPEAFELVNKAIREHLAQ